MSTHAGVIAKARSAKSKLSSDPEAWLNLMPSAGDLAQALVMAMRENDDLRERLEVQRLAKQAAESAARAAAATARRETRSRLRIIGHLRGVLSERDALRATLRKVRAALDAFDKFAMPVEGAEDQPRSRTVLDAALVDTRAGRPAELRAVARIYLHEDYRRRPTQAVLELGGYGSRETAYRRVQEAREKGLIPPKGASDEEMKAAFRRLDEGQHDGEEG